MLGILQFRFLTVLSLNTRGSDEKEGEKEGEKKEKKKKEKDRLIGYLALGVFTKYIRYIIER